MAFFRGLGNVGLRAGRGIGGGIKRAGLAAGAAAAVIPATILANSPDFQLLAAAIGGSVGLAKSGLSGLKNIGKGLKEDFGSGGKNGDKNGAGGESEAVSWLKDIAEKMAKLLTSSQALLKLFTQAFKRGQKRREKGQLLLAERVEESALPSGETPQKAFGALKSLLGTINTVMKWGKLLKLALLGGLLLLLPAIYQFLKNVSWKQITEKFQEILAFIKEHVIPVLAWAWKKVIWPVLEWLGHGLKKFFFDFHQYLQGKKGIWGLMADNILLLAVIALSFVGVKTALLAFGGWILKMAGVKGAAIATGAIAAGGFWGLALLSGKVVLALGIVMLGLYATYKAFQTMGTEWEKSKSWWKAFSAGTDEWSAIFFGTITNLAASIVQWAARFILGIEIDLNKFDARASIRKELQRPDKALDAEALRIMPGGLGIAARSMLFWLGLSGKPHPKEGKPTTGGIWSSNWQGFGPTWHAGFLYPPGWKGVPADSPLANLRATLGGNRLNMMSVEDQKLARAAAIKAAAKKAATEKEISDYEARYQKLKKDYKRDFGLFAAFPGEEAAAAAVGRGVVRGLGLRPGAGKVDTTPEGKIHAMIEAGASWEAVNKALGRFRGTSEGSAVSMPQNYEKARDMEAAAARIAVEEKKPQIVVFRSPDRIAPAPAPVFDTGKGVSRAGSFNIHALSMGKANINPPGMANNWPYGPLGQPQ